MTIDELLAHSKKEYIAKIGNTFLVSPMSEEIAESISPRELDKYFQECPSEMIRCLKNTPNVVEYSSDMNSELLGGFCIKKEEHEFEGQEPKTFEVSGLAPNFSDHINFQVMWPRKNQDVPSWYSGEVAETFHILYDGVIFLAFGDNFVGDRSYAWQFGLEAMKIIKCCFERSTLWKVIATGPIMLHPALYFVFLDPKIDLTFPNSRESHGDLYVFFPYQNDTACEFTVRQFFHSVAYEVKGHYGNQLLREEIMKTELNFRRQFETLCSLHRNVVKPNSWNPVATKKRYSHIGQVRNGIREAYELYVNLMDMQAGITQERTCCRARLAQHQFLRPMASYFDEQLSDVGQTDFSPILQGLRFLEEETRMISTIRSNLQAALIGALAAAIIYALVSVFLG